MIVELELTDGSTETLEHPVEAKAVSFKEGRTDVLVYWKEMVDTMDRLSSSDEIDMYLDATISRVVQ